MALPGLILAAALATNPPAVADAVRIERSAGTLIGEAAAGLAVSTAALLIAAHYGFSLYFALGPGLGDAAALLPAMVLSPIGAALGAWYVATLEPNASVSFRAALHGALLGSLASAVLAGVWLFARPPAGTEALGLLAMPVLSTAGAVIGLESSRVVPTLAVARAADGSAAFGPALAGA